MRNRSSALSLLLLLVLMSTGSFTLEGEARTSSAQAEAPGTETTPTPEDSGGEVVGGKWTPEQILAHDAAWLRRLGLEVPAQELWKPEGGGLLEAVVQVGGCSSGFVSPQGLLVTNHHCAFSLVQEHSTPERDLLADGFLATDVSAELPGTITRALIPHHFQDVTAEIEAAAQAAGGDDLARYKAIDRKSKELVAACEDQPHRRCRVAIYDDGVVYRLVESLEFPDVRLVYAPPTAIGEFGGEVDNWTWPRHTGDFALLRVYAEGGEKPAPYSPDNLPYRPKRSLQVATQGVADGDFVMVAGYPGLTYRSWIADEAAERLELYFPQRAELYRAWIDLMEAASEEDEEARIALAGRIKGLLNREKNSRGQVAGIRRGQLIEKKRQGEAAILEWARASGTPEHAAALEAHRELNELVQEKRATWQRQFLLQQADSGSLALGLAIELVRWAREREKPDLERLAQFQERNRDRLLAGQGRDQKRLHAPIEVSLLADTLERLAALPSGQEVRAVEELLAGEKTPASVASQLLSGSQIGKLEARLAMFEESSEELRGRGDPLLAFTFDLVEEIEAVEQEGDRRTGAFSRLRPAWRRTVAAYEQAELGRPLDPDANGTLRVSLARVKGYEPREAVWYRPRTTLAGVIEKHTGESPFDVPDPVLEAAAKRSRSRWLDPALGDVPVGFLATGDTTGGSSGSPVLNGRGELVGVNFDRVWENVANDFGYNPAIARNVSVDVRYLLWMLDELGGPEADRLLREMGLEPGGS